MLRVNTHHISTLKGPKAVKNYAVWLYFKQIFRNSVFYRFSFHAFAKQYDISRRMAKNHISTFLKLGWCTLKNKDLQFADHAQIAGNEQFTLITCNVTIPFLKPSISDILAALQAHIVSCPLPDGVSQIPTPCPRGTEGGSTNTIRECGRLLKTSVRNANHIVLKLQRKYRYFTRFKNWCILEVGISKKVFDDMKDTLTGCIFWSKGRIIQAKPHHWEWSTPSQ